MKSKPGETKTRSASSKPYISTSSDGIDVKSSSSKDRVVVVAVSPESSGSRSRSKEHVAPTSSVDVPRRQRDSNEVDIKPSKSKQSKVSNSDDRDLKRSWSKLRAAPQTGEVDKDLKRSRSKQRLIPTSTTTDDDANVHSSRSKHRSAVPSDDSDLKRSWPLQRSRSKQRAVPKAENKVPETPSLPEPKIDASPSTTNPEMMEPYGPTLPTIKVRIRDSIFDVSFNSLTDTANIIGDCMGSAMGETYYCDDCNERVPFYDLQQEESSDGIDTDQKVTKYYHKICYQLRKEKEAKQNRKKDGPAEIQQYSNQNEMERYKVALRDGDNIVDAIEVEPSREDVIECSVCTLGEFCISTIFFAVFGAENKCTECHKPIAWIESQMVLKQGETTKMYFHKNCFDFRREIDKAKHADGDNSANDNDKQLQDSSLKENPLLRKQSSRLGKKDKNNKKKKNVRATNEEFEAAPMLKRVFSRPHGSIRVAKKHSVAPAESAPAAVNEASKIKRNSSFNLAKK